MRNVLLPEYFVMTIPSPNVGKLILEMSYEDVDMVAVTDYCGIVSGSKIDKSRLFDVFYGQLNAAPLITDCPLNIECQLVQTMDLPTNTLFIGEIVNICSEKQYLQNGKPNVRKVQPFLLTMPDNRFWSVGEQVGKAWKDGVAYLKKMNHDRTLS
jgi:flavin reductase (DIM6/NTAB) family NADH-FMN oxidoreductase RutF